MARRFKVKPIRKSKRALAKVKDKLPSTGPEEEPTSPRITNDTVAEHREEVLSGGRRFLYPLQHSKHRVVIISAGLIVLLLLATSVLSWLMLYRWQETSNFAYRVTEIIPVPVAKVDGEYVAYERYLFELRSSLYYYENHAQEGVDINGPEGERIIQEAKIKALEKAKLDSLAEKYAEEKGIVVTKEEIDNQIKSIQSQGGIDETTGVLNDVLSDFYGWDLDDLKKVVKAQLIRQKLPAILDTETIDEATKVLAELGEGKEFSDLAKQYSDDTSSKDKGGDLEAFTRDNKELPKEFVEAAFALEEGETTTELVKTPVGLHIIKLNKKADDKVEVSHILFRYFNINDYLKKQFDAVENNDYIKL